MLGLQKRIMLFSVFTIWSSLLFAQSSISGSVINSSTKEPLMGVNITVLGSNLGTTTEQNGNFILALNQSPPFTLRFSFLGFKTKEIILQDSNSILKVEMEESPILGQEVVISASRLKQNILKSPVSIEKMGLNTIQQTPYADFYEGVANLKGVQVTQSSFNFVSVNTRGFSDISNSRFVQIVEGMDTADPTINSNLGSILGLGQLDIESLELLPGASSALYGPNAFNGVMIMTGKNPFDYEGLSIMVNQGFTDSNAGGTHGMGTYSFRYAKAFNEKLAFKVNFYYLTAEDWVGNDYRTDRNNPDSTVDLRDDPNFDGLNLHGDETAIPINAFGIETLRRTGIEEQTLLDHNDATTLKADVSVHYRLNNTLELIGMYRVATGNSVGQSNTKYAYRDFVQEFYKLELNSDNFFIRSYLSASNVDDTFDVGALGALVNERFNPSINADGTGWVPDYITAFLGGIPNVNPNDHAAARAYADRFMIDANTGQYVPSFNNVVDEIRSIDYQSNPPGASLYSKSNIWNSEVFYNFNQTEWADIIVGGNFKRYSLFSGNTLFNEAPDPDSNPERFFTHTFGAYTQLSKNLTEQLNLTASIRFDKMDDFEGQFTPRVALVYSPNENNNIRINYQTGFRFPDMIQQFIYFPTPEGIALGGTPSNAERYGVYNGGLWTQASFNDFASQGGTVDPTTGAILTNPGNVTLETLNVSYLKPEELTSFEIGYNTIISKSLLLDFNYYHNRYTNFMGQQRGVNKVATSHRGNQIDVGTAWSLYTNSPTQLKSDGLGLGITYNLPNNFVLNGNYTYTTFSGNQPDGFLTFFNTPKNRFNIGFSNNRLTKNLGFNMNFRYQDTFLWESDYGRATIPSYSLFDAQINYNLSAFNTLIKIGGTNIGGSDYRTNFGASFIGQTYYVSIILNDLL